MNRFLALRAIRFRTAQSVLLAVLALAAVAACAVGPMYERAVEQAALRSSVLSAPVGERGLRIDAANPRDAQAYLPTGPQRRLFGPAIEGVEAPIQVDWDTPLHNFIGTAVNRTDYCAHLSFVAGRCSSAADEVVASESSAKAFGFSIGQKLDVLGTGGSGRYRLGALTVVGLYRVFDGNDDYWFGRAYSSPSGVLHIRNGDRPDILRADAFFVSADAIDAYGARYDEQVGGFPPFAGALDVPLAVSRLSVDDIATLRTTVAEVNQRIAQKYAVGDPQRGRLTTDLPHLLDVAEKGRGQSRLIIPTLGAQLAIVVLVLLGMVIAVGVEQRRPELALARLRGRSRASAARFFVGEITALVLITLVPGLLAAWGLTALLCRLLLPGGVTPELRWPMVAAGAAVSAVTMAMAVLMARRAAAQPIQDLLRSVAPRRSGRAVGVLEIAVGIAALGGLVAVLTGGSKSALALLTPGLLAVLAGLVLSRVVLLVARAVGRRAMWRNRLATAVAALQVARSTSFRRIITLICVAVALTISAVDQWSVAGTQREARAAVEVGAPVVLTVQTPSGLALRTAVTEADPDGQYAMPVIVQRPAGGESPVVALVGTRARSAMSWGSSRDTPAASTLAELAPRHAPPAIDVTGKVVRLKVAHVSVTPVQHGGDVPPDALPGPVSLRLYFRLPDGTLTSTTLPLTTSPRPSESSDVFGGCARGCQLSRLELVRAGGDYSEAKIEIAIDELSVGPSATQLSPVSLGNAADWGNVNADAAAAGTADQIGFVDGDSATILRSDSHGSSALLQHLDVPVALPCLLAGAPDNDRVGKNGLAIHGIDNNAVSCRPVGSLPFVPGVGRTAVVVDLTLAIGVSTSALTRSTGYVFLSRDDPAQERALLSALNNAGVSVQGRATTASRLVSFDDSPPAWAIQVALLAACAAALVAALLVIVIAFISRRGRARDLAALRLVGVPLKTVRRAVVGEQLIAVVVGAVVGAVVGVIGARLALPAMPLFVQPADVPKPVFDTHWGATSVALVATLGLLLVAALVAAWLLSRRLGADRLREGGL